MRHTFSILFLFSLLVCHAQKEANIWYFGSNAGLDFNTGSPVPITDGQINTQESCGSIADANGQLLFYTDGIRVYDRNHNIMPNGTGLLGNESASQSGTIVPKPGSATLFYIFTTANEHDPDGFRYTVVDITQNGGMGAVTAEKNVQVFTPSLECISVIKKANNTDFWIMGHGWNSNNFYAYSLTASGLENVPVTSSVGAIITGNGFQAAAQIKFAPSGSKMAFTCVADVAQLFDFNNATGIVSNPVTLSTESGELSGIEFSPDESRLYVANSFYRIYQYDLTASDIPNSKLTLYNGNRAPGALQLGPDGKIYVAFYGYNRMGVINSPNSLGTTCDFQVAAIDLAGKVCNLGLPAFNRSFFESSFRADNLCLGSATNFSLTATANITSVVWNFGDGSPTSPVLNPTHIYTSAGTYPVSVMVNTIAGSIAKTKMVTISSMPNNAATISNISVCGQNINHDLSQYTDTLLANQALGQFEVAYFITMPDLVSHRNLLASNYNLAIGNNIFFVKIYSISNPNCYVATSFTVNLSQQPIATTPSDYIICESLPYDNTEVFDLSTKNSQILNGQSASVFSVSYHSSQANADSGLFPLPNLYNNIQAQQTLYARVENSTTPSCHATTTLNLKVVHLPQLTTVSDFMVCDDRSNDGISSFNLNQKTTEILNGQPPTAFKVYYYHTLTDAQNNANPITASINNTSINQTIFYSIAAIGNIGCRAISYFNLVVSSTPTASVPDPLFICDDTSNDGVGLFNLNDRRTQITGQNGTQFTVTYHLNQNDADRGLNQLPANYQNINNPQTLFTRVQNNQNRNCFSTASIQIGLHKMPTAFQPQGLMECDDQLNDGKAIFDLSQQTPAILGLQSLVDYDVSYHANLPDANLGSNGLSLNYTNTSNPQTVYARIENKLSQSCFSIASFTLFVKAAPELNMDDYYSNCEGNAIIIQAPAGFSAYNWSNGANTPSTSIATAGNYSLTVTKNYGTLSCTTSKDFTVYNSNKAIINTIETTDWTDNRNTITVHLSAASLGDYEYSLDGIHYQDSNIFEGLASGQYTVYVNDKKHCGEVTQDVILLTYPKFFTPNGDGFNDVWHIKFSQIEPHMELKIFDRYGKILTIFKGSDFGWDGILNGKPVPADDYWFVVKRENGKEFKGHFSLLR